MNALREWVSRLRGTLRPRRDDRDLEEELRLHVELAAEEARRRGDAPERAMRTATIDAGGIAQAMEAQRDQRGLPWLEDLANDVRYTVRTLRAKPGFTIGIVLTQQEIGVRMALGATRADVARLVVGGGMRLVVAGLVFGGIVAVWAGRSVEPLLFEQSASDPIVFVSVGALLLGVALLATALPALSAARVDPQLALRAD